MNKSLNKRIRLKGSFNSVSLVAFLCLVSSCNVNRHIETSVIINKPPSIAYKDFCRNNIKLFAFQLEDGMINFKQNGKEYSSEAVLKSIHDSILQVSVLPAMGLEAYRLIMCKDSILLIDRINKDAYIGVHGIQNRTKKSFSLIGIFQDLIVGNLPDMDEADSVKLIDYQDDLIRYRVFAKVNFYQENILIENLLFDIDCKTGKLSKVSVVSSKGKIEFNYSDFFKFHRMLVPSSVNIVLIDQRGNRTEIGFRFKNILRKNSVKGWSGLPKGYKQYELKIF